MDLLIHVVRAFDDENITHVSLAHVVIFLTASLPHSCVMYHVCHMNQCEETIDPIRDIKIVNDELIEKVTTCIHDLM